MLAEVVKKYFLKYPKDKQRLALFRRQLKDKEHLSGRLNYTGHATGSMLIFTPDLKKVLLVYHPTFSRWQQPGGHWEDGEEGPWVAAAREVEEEVGLKLEIEPLADAGDARVPVDIDSHFVPRTPPKNEPDHYHHDFKYAVIVEEQELNLTDEVIKEASWVPVADVQHSDLARAINRAIELLRLKA